MDRQMQVLNEKYQRLHQTGKRLAKIKSKNSGNISFQIGNLINLNEFIKIDCSGLPQDLKVLLFDILKRGYHPLTSDRNKYEEQVQNKKHTIIEEQAINIIWGCLGRELGKTFLKESIVNVKEQLLTKLMNIDVGNNLEKHEYIKADQHELKMDKYDRLVEERNMIRKRIEDKAENIIQRYNEEEPQIQKERYLISKILEKDIIETENSVFEKTLVGIQIQQGSAILIFEQCYPNMRMSYHEAKQYVGQKIFNQKVTKYKQIKNTMKSNCTINFCHFCLQPLSESEPKKCDNKMARQNIENLILTDPFIYYQNVLCQYVPKLTGNQSYIHPYLKYYKVTRTQKSYLCNRYICHQCFTRYYTGTYGSCQYCEGSCDCPRCSSLDYLTKAIGLYFLYSQQSQETFRIFQKFKFRFDHQNLKIKSCCKNTAKQDRFSNLIKSISHENRNQDWVGRFKYQPKTSFQIKQKSFFKQHKPENQIVLREEKRKKPIERQKQKISKNRIKEKKKTEFSSPLEGSSNQDKNNYYFDSES